MALAYVIVRSSDSAAIECLRIRKTRSTSAKLCTAVPSIKLQGFAGFQFLFDIARRSASFGAICSKMAVADVVLLLEYNVDLLPIDGPQILASSAAPVKHIGKDAAGHKFHHFALLQRGVISESQEALLKPMHVSYTRTCSRVLTLTILHSINLAMMQALSKSQCAFDGLQGLRPL